MATAAEKIEDVQDISMAMVSFATNLMPQQTVAVKKAGYKTFRKKKTPGQRGCLIYSHFAFTFLGQSVKKYFELVSKVYHHLNNILEHFRRQPAHGDGYTYRKSERTMAVTPNQCETKPVFRMLTGESLDLDSLGCGGDMLNESVIETYLD